MPENMPGPPPEESKSSHPFDMSADEARQLGMTASEWMRHRWTGEMPDHVTASQRQVEREQTARARQFPPLRPPAAAAPESHSEP